MNIQNVEPRSKKAMPVEDQLNLQRQVLQTLETRRRQSYRGPVVMQLRLSTTDRTPAHAHTLAKNILDLLGRPLTQLATSRKGLLYFDDTQIHALSVSCEHGTEVPNIFIKIQSLGDFHDDLRLALYVLAQDGGEEWDDIDEEDEFALYRDLITDERLLRPRVGDKAFDMLLDTSKRSAQRQFLGHAKLHPRDLAYFFRAWDLRYTEHQEMWDDLALRWEDIFKTTPLRILIGELPSLQDKK